MKIIFPRVTYKNTLIALLILAGIAFSLYSVLFYVIAVKTEDVSVLIQELESEVVKEQEFLTIKKILAATVEDREKLDAYFVRTDSAVDLIERIESLGVHAGVVVSFESLAVKGDVQSFLDLNFTTKGDFDDMLYFFSLLESLPLALSFEKVFISKNESKDPKDTIAGEWKGSFTMAVSSFINE